MRLLVVGKGVQGTKRASLSPENIYGFVDPNVLDADFTAISEAPLNNFDAVLLCVPDALKQSLIEYCIHHKKHVLVEKPLVFEDLEKFYEIEKAANKNSVVIYTAYNHRFEPHFVRMKDLIESDELGEHYRCRIFYGNGTARLVKESSWRDAGSGVLHDLGSHLIDLVQFWFGGAGEGLEWRKVSSNSFENDAPVHFVVQTEIGEMSVELEMTMLMWRNHFTCDLLSANGSAHISSLCKWGPSSFVKRKRVFPSGRPIETQITLTQPDPTWLSEMAHFKSLVEGDHKTDFSWDRQIQSQLQKLYPSS